MRISLSQLFIAIAVLMISACGGGSGTEESGGTPGEQPGEQGGEPGVLGGLNSVVGVSSYQLADEGSAAYSEVLTYRMPAVNGGVTKENAVVLIPPGAPPTGGFPVVAWGHQTTGVGDACAPSASNDLAGYASYVDQLFLQNGFAVVAPDFEGLGTDGSHPYLHLASSGRSLIYAVDAAVQQYRDLSSHYAVVGYSQGGHAALGAGEYANELSSIELAGVVAIAPPSDFREQHRALTATIEASQSIAEAARAAYTQLLFSSLVLAGVSAVEPQMDFADFFGSAGELLRDGVDTTCLDNLTGTLNSSIAGALLSTGDINSVIPNDVVEIPEVAQYLSSNEPGSEVIDVPVLLLQGVFDSVVFPESTEKLGNLLRNVNGTAVTSYTYPTADHFDVVEQSRGDVISFLSGLFTTSE